MRSFLMQLRSMYLTLYWSRGACLSPRRRTSTQLRWDCFASFGFAFMLLFCLLACLHPSKQSTDWGTQKCLNPDWHEVKLNSDIRGCDYWIIAPLVEFIPTLVLVGNLLIRVVWVIVIYFLDFKLQVSKEQIQRHIEIKVMARRKQSLIHTGNGQVRK